MTIDVKHHFRVCKRKKDMLNLRKGCKVPFPKKLFEGYTYTAPCFTANVNADKMEKLLENFIELHREPLFFILELPTNQADETELRPGEVASFHKDVYYIDGCTQESALRLLHRFADLLIHDGGCAFGFGGHQTQDEIMIGKYNVVSLFTKNTKLYADFFETLGIPKTENLQTAWDTFSQDFPGRAECIETDGRTVYDLPEILKAEGIYFAERREA